MEKDILIKRVEEMDISDDTKSRVVDALETMLAGSRYYFVKSDEYKEYSVIINNTIVVKTKQYDIYGSTTLRGEDIYSLEDYVAYHESKIEELNGDRRTMGR